MRIASSFVATLLVVSVELVCCKIHHEDSLKVCSPNAGCMIGSYMPGYRSERFEAFMGIPYAMPPIGDLRFRNPRSHPRWSGVLNATLPKADCIQKNYLLPTPLVSGSEDCLYLNVYRPTIRCKDLPVMVYIHGGGWFSGSANPMIVGPEYFMDTKEVIIVTIAYRLGPFGFLSAGDDNMPGNFGLKDQNLALHWVQRNIASFGGNPQRVTIFGQSAGGVSTHLHMLSRQSEGLFNGVISMSGTANVPFGILDNPHEQFRQYASLCNITNANELSTAKLTKALRTIDAETLLQAGDGLKFWNIDHLTNFRPVVEKECSKDAFLTRHPLEILKDGDYKSVPWLVGFVPNEGAVRVLAIYTNDTQRNDFNQDFNSIFEKLMEFPDSFSAIQMKQKTNIILQEYFNGVLEINEDTLQGFLDTITDRGFLNPLYNALRLYVNTEQANTSTAYVYKFNYYGPPTHTFAHIYTGKFSEENYGVVHCDDLIYCFRSPLFFGDFAKNSTQADVMQKFVGNFVNFAKFGQPLNANQCSKNAFDEYGFCDYQEFINVEPASFDIVSRHAFNTDRMTMWNDILEGTNV